VSWTRRAGVFAAVLLAALVAVSTAAAVVTISRAELSGGRLRIEGSRAVANAPITVDGVQMGQADGAGNFRIERSGFSDADCRVAVDDGTGPVTTTLSGCSPSAPPPPSPTPSPSPSPSPTTTASFQGLGFLPGGVNSFATDVSGDGKVIVGWSGFENGSVRAWRWTAATGLVDIGDLGGGAAEAHAVSADGNTIVGRSWDASQQQTAFRWRAGLGMQPVPILEASDVSGDGSVVIGFAIRWTEAGGSELLPNFGGGSTFAEATSEDGSIITGSSVKDASCGFRFGPTCHRAFRWTRAGGLQDIGHLGGLESVGRGMNPTGSVIVGESRNKDLWWNAFRWTASSGMVNMKTLGGPQSAAYDASSDGSVIVGKSLTTSSTASERAFRWTSNRQMQDLKRELLDHGVSSVQNWTLMWARAVSNDGTVIAGAARNPQLQFEAWRATLPR
jgi:probable HAF family extracellular repeat protein